MHELIAERVRERKARLTDLRAKISQAREVVEACEREASLVEAELRAYVDVEGILASVGATPPQIPEGRPVLAKRPTVARGGVPDRMGETVRQILSFAVDRYPEPFTNDALVQEVERRGFKISRDYLRSILFTYSSQGLLEKVATASHRVTAVGAARIGRELPHVAETPKANPTDTPPS